MREWDAIRTHDDHDLAMTVLGDRVVVCGETSVLTVWDYTTGAKVFDLACTTRVKCVAVSPNQRFIAAICSSQSVRVWNTETSECVFDLFDDYGGGEIFDGLLLFRNNGVAVSNDSVAATNGSREVKLYSIATSEVLCRKKADRCVRGLSECHGVVLSRCGDMLVFGARGGVKIVDVSHLP